MSPVKIDIEARGLDEQIRKLEQFDRIAAPHIRQASAQGVELIVKGWQGVVNSVSGQYQGSIVGNVKQVTGLTSRAIASTDALAQNRYPYPFMLEKSGRFKKTRGKVARKLQSQRRAVERFFAAAIDRIVHDLQVRG